jgi:hypothetical protein
MAGGLFKGAVVTAVTALFVRQFFRRVQRDRCKRKKAAAVGSEGFLNGLGNLGRWFERSERF